MRARAKAGKREKKIGFIAQSEKVLENFTPRVVEML